MADLAALIARTRRLARLAKDMATLLDGLEQALEELLEPRRDSSGRQLPSMQILHWDTAQTAAYLKLSKRTLEKWRVVGGGPPYRKFGKKVLYDSAAVKAWAERKERETTYER